MPSLACMCGKPLVSTTIYLTHLAWEVLTTFVFPRHNILHTHPLLWPTMAPRRKKTLGERREDAIRQQWLKEHLRIRHFDVELAGGRDLDDESVFVTTSYGTNFGRCWVQIVGFIAAVWYMMLKRLEWDAQTVVFPGITPRIQIGCAKSVQRVLEGT